MKKPLAIFIVITLFQLGCATNSKSLFLGGVIGAGAGVVISNQKGSSKNAAVGALIGAGIGSLIGVSAYKEKLKKMGTKSPDLKGIKNFSPFLIRPKVRMYWVPDNVQGNKFIEKHRVWVIKNPSSWSKD